MAEPTLKAFPKVPCPGMITAAEYGAQLISVLSTPDNPVEGEQFCDKISSYRKINASNLKPIFQSKIPPVRTRTYEKSVMITKDAGIIKGMWDACRESGWRGLEQYLKQLEKNPATNMLFRCLSVLTSVTDRVYKMKHDAYIKIFPHYGLETMAVIKQASQVRNWNKAWLKAVAWHPNSPMLAFALQDDSVRICEVGQEVLPLLRSQQQKDVSCVSFRPYSKLQLAVGVSSGIVIWKLETTDKIKPGACQSKLLTMRGHSPVTSVEYSHSGLFLLSSSSFDMSIYIWDVGNWSNTALYRVGGGGVPFASWSSGDDKIISTSPSTVFRIWDREQHWKPKRWKTPQYPIDAACWTPDSSTLLFTSGEMIYAVHFAVNLIEKFIHDDKLICFPVFDIAACTVPTEDYKLEYKVGGRVRKMDVDPSGNRLAVCFDDSELIAVFRLQQRSPCYLAPCGFIRGYADDFPLTLIFQKDFTDGALLTIAWNSGRLQYFPFLFGGTDSMKNLLHEDYYKIPSVLQNTPKSQSATRPKASIGSTSFVHDLSQDENVIIPNPNLNTSFKTTFFKDMRSSEDFEFVTSPNATSPRLFSLEQRSPSSL